MDVHAASTDAILCLTAYICDLACDTWVGPNSNVNNLPGKRGLYLILLSSFMGVLRYSICYRIRAILLIHKWCSRLSTQVGIALIGLQFVVISFGNSFIGKYLTNSFEIETYGPIEKTLFTIVVFANLLHIQHVDSVVPTLFGILPIIISVFVNGINVFITGIFAVITTVSAIYFQKREFSIFREIQRIVVPLFFVFQTFL